MENNQIQNPAFALITGASAGIGAEFARQLAKAGYHLILVARRREKLDEISRQIRELYPVQVEILSADLSTESGIQRVEDHIKTIGNLQFLINNAGFGIPGLFFENPIDTTLTMVTVHVLATIRLSRAALPSMLQCKSGNIINVSSVSAFSAATGSPTYSATKAYLNNFSEGLSVELTGTGVKVQALCPGFTITEFHDTPLFEKMRIKQRLPRIAWMTAKEVVQQSLRALNRNQVIFIPGFGNRLLALAGRLGLTSFILRLITFITGKRPNQLDE